VVVCAIAKEWPTARSVATIKVREQSSFIFIGLKRIDGSAQFSVRSLLKNWDGQPISPWVITPFQHFRDDEIGVNPVFQHPVKYHYRFSVPVLAFVI
jgi:hypothetical protein